MIIRDSDFPREKLLTNNVKSLKDYELVSLILKTGGRDKNVFELSKEILKYFNGISGIYKAEIQELIKFENIGLAKAASIKAGIELGIRYKNIDVPTKINSPKDVYKLLLSEITGLDKEQLFLLSLNSRNTLIAKDIISVGSINETLLDPREILKQAFKRNAVAIIIAHNHPSDDPTPSEQDIRVTEKIATGAKEVGIPLIDHVIVTTGQYQSLKSLGIFKTYNEK